MNTKEEVVAALAKEPKQRADGKLLCQVCGAPFRKQGMGPHQIKHRQDVGLIERRTMVKLPKNAKLVCPHCHLPYHPHSIPGHLRNRHGLSADEAVNTAQQIRREFVASRNGERETSRAVAVLADKTDEEPSMWREVSAVDAATDILARARRDGQVPIRLLPDVFEWVVTTGKLLHRLEQLSR